MFGINNITMRPGMIEKIMIKVWRRKFGVLLKGGNNFISKIYEQLFASFVIDQGFDLSYEFFDVFW